MGKQYFCFLPCVNFIFELTFGYNGYLLTYLLTPWRRVLEKLTGLQLVKKFPVLYCTRRFLTSFTNVRHLSLSWANSIQSTPSHLTSWWSILILSSHLRLGLPSSLFPSGFPTKNPVYASPLPRTRYVTRPSHSSQFRLEWLRNSKSRKREKIEKGRSGLLRNEDRVLQKHKFLQNHLLAGRLQKAILFLQPITEQIFTPMKFYVIINNFLTVTLSLRENL